MEGLMNWAGNNDHTFMWVVYLLGSIGLLLVLWRLTRNWNGLLRFPLLAIGACVLLVPRLVTEEGGLYAPALAVAPLKWLSGGLEAASPALFSIVGWIAAALALLAGVFFFRRKRGLGAASNSSTGPSTVAASEAATDSSDDSSSEPPTFAEILAANKAAADPATDQAS